MSTKKLNKAELNETARLILAANAKQGKKDVTIQKPKPEVVPVPAAVHVLAVKMVTAEGKYDAVMNAVYAAFKAYAITTVPLMVREAVRHAAIVDLHKTFGESRKAAAIQRITMLNNMAIIAHGKAETRDTPAQAAQGMKVVIEALNACESLPALKKALTLLKVAKHGATGVPKVEPKGDKGAASEPKASDVPELPATRKDALKSMVSMLQTVARVHLTTADHAIVLEIDKLVKMLKAA